MRFVPRLSVGGRLTLTVLTVVVLSWLLSATVFFQLVRLGVIPRRGPGPHRGPPGFSRSADVGRDGFRREPGMGPGEPEGRGFPPPPPGRGGRRGGPPRRPPLWRDHRLFVHLGVGLVLSVAAGIWLGRRFTRPLTMLAQGAEALRAGQLDHRVPLGGDDEFGRVATSMNQMARRLAEQIRALEADHRRRQHLLADVAHELRSPVASMKTMAEALRDGIASGPERTQRASHAIADSAARMEHLISDLLQLARLDMDELPLHRQPVDLRAAAADCLRRHAESAEEAGLRVRPMSEGEPAVVSGDPHRLAQILDNLVDNAISHAGEGAEVWVTVEAGDPVAVTVADSGRGIAAANLPYVFDSFYRGDSARSPRDRHSGLGLRIALGLARAHGGDLRIESIEGEGTRAILTMPSASGDGASETSSRSGVADSHECGVPRAT